MVNIVVRLYAFFSHSDLREKMYGSRHRGEDMSDSDEDRVSKHHIKWLITPSHRMICNRISGGYTQALPLSQCVGQVPFNMYRVDYYQII